MANHGPVGQPRNGIVWWILLLVLGACTGIGGLIIYILWYIMKVGKEVKEFTQNEKLFAPILFIIPYFNFYVLYCYAKALNETQTKIGMPEADRVNPIMVTILALVAGFGLGMFQNNLNKTWEFAGGKK
jgi:hypothetical protein